MGYICLHSPDLLQAQCLINVSGDAVIFTRESETDVTSSAALQQSSQTSAGEGT